MTLLRLILPILTISGSMSYGFSADAPKETSKIFSPTVSGKTSYEDNKSVVVSFYEAMQNNNNELLNSILVPEYHVVNIGEILDSSYSKFTEMSKNLKVRMAALHKALPDFKLEVSELLVDGNKVVARVTISGLQKGTFLGIVPTQKPIHIKLLDLFTVKDGKITHVAEMWNELSVMKQLGYIVL